jgi:hypothetical protein
MRPPFLRTAKFALAACGLTLALLRGTAWSQAPADVAPPENPPASAPPAAPAAKPGAALSIEQAKLADKYKRLEELLLRRAEVAAATDPERATLLRQVVSKSKDAHIENQFEVLVELLAKSNSRSYSQALTGQTELQKDLKLLLELLSSEDRSHQLESEQARIKEYLKRVNKLIRGQKSLQGQTENGADAKNLAERQAKLAGDAGKLAGDIEADDKAKQSEQGNSDGKEDAGKDPSDNPQDSKPGKNSDDGNKQGQDGQGKQGEGKQSDGKQGEGKQGDQGDGKHGSEGDGKQGEGKQGEGKQGEGKQTEGKQGEGKQGEPQDGQPQPSEGEPQPGQPNSGSPMPGQPGQPGQPSQGQPGQGQRQPSEGESGGGEPQPQQQDEGNPARKRIQAAEQRMRKAAEKLEKAEREDAVEEQEEARRELEQAAAELERILRQLREEEVERMLVALEARFRKMLEQETEVHQSTKRLGAIPPDKRDREIDIEAGRLSRKQGEIGRECDKALTLLREEGSAVAFPEAVTQMREDMQLSTDYLAQAKVDRLTQGVQEDIIAALEEMIAALEKAIEDLQQNKGKPPPGGGGEPGEEPLVDNLAELKMIRSLQMRVNRRTAEYGAMIQGEQADKADLLEGLQQLADRQDRIYRSTRDIVVGRNE